MLPPASKMTKATIKSREEREKQVNDFENIIDKEQLAKIAKLMEYSTSIYLGSCNVAFEMGKATIKHLKDLGYSVHKNTHGTCTTISWPPR